MKLILYTKNKLVEIRDEYKYNFKLYVHLVSGRITSRWEKAFVFTSETKKGVLLCYLVSFEID